MKGWMLFKLLSWSFLPTMVWWAHWSSLRAHEMGCFWTKQDLQMHLTGPDLSRSDSPQEQTPSTPKQNPMWVVQPRGLLCRCTPTALRRLPVQPQTWVIQYFHSTKKEEQKPTDFTDFKCLASSYIPASPLTVPACFATLYRTQPAYVLSHGREC